MSIIKFAYPLISLFICLTNSLHFQGQLDKLESKEATESRKFERTLDQKDFDIARTNQRMVEAENRCQTYMKRISDLEKQVASGQDALFNKEMILKEEQQRIKAMESRVEDVKKSMESEMRSCRQQVQDEKNRTEEASMKHRAEMEQFKTEVEENLPHVAEAAASRIEKTWEKRMVVEMGSLKLRYESEIEALKREIMELNASFAERDARRRVTLAEERAELENLRSVCHSLKKSIVAGDILGEGGVNENHNGQYYTADDQSIFASQARVPANRNRLQRHPLQAMNTPFSSQMPTAGDKNVDNASAFQPEAYSKLATELHSMKYQLSASLGLSTPRMPLTANQLVAETVQKVPSPSALFASPQPVNATVSRAVFGTQEVRNGASSDHYGDEAEIDGMGGSTLEDGGLELSNISVNDGGFHPGYWRAKYKS